MDNFLEQKKNTSSYNSGLCTYQPVILTDLEFGFLLLFRKLLPNSIIPKVTLSKLEFVILVSYSSFEIIHYH